MPIRQQVSMLKHSHCSRPLALFESLFERFGGVPRPFSRAGRDDTDLLYSRHGLVRPEQGRMGGNRIKITRSLAHTFHCSACQLPTLLSCLDVTTTLFLSLLYSFWRPLLLALSRARLSFSSSLEGIGHFLLTVILFIGTTSSKDCTRC